MGNQFDDTSIKSFFLIEAREYIDTFRKAVTLLSKKENVYKAVLEIQKTAHTLKGSAGMLKFMNLSKVAFYMETLMKILASQKTNLPIPIHDQVGFLIKLMEKMIDNIELGQQEHNQELIDENQRRIDKIIQLYSGEVPVQPEILVEPEEIIIDDRLKVEFSSPAKQAQTEPPGLQQQEIPIEIEKPVPEPSSVAEELASQQPDELTEIKPEDIEIPKSGMKNDLSFSPESPESTPEEASIQEAESPGVSEKAKSTQATGDGYFAGIDTQSYEPKKSDFFLPSTQTAPVGEETGERAVADEMSFLDMIPDIKEAFILEATDHIQNIDHLLLEWESDSENPELTNQLLRAMHSLKGSAGTVGFPEMGEISHKMEDVIENAKDKKLEVDIELVDTLFESLDTIKLLLKGLEGQRIDKNLLFKTASEKLSALLKGERPKKAEKEEKETPAPAPAPTPVEPEKKEEETSKLLQQEESVVDTEDAIMPKIISLEELETTPDEQSDMHEPGLAEGAPEKSPVATQRTGLFQIGDTEKQIVRVHINQLNTLMNLVGELVINRSKLDKRVDIFRQIGDELSFSRSKLLEVVEEFTEKYEFTLPDISGIKDEAFDEFTSLEFDKYDDFNILSRSLMEIGSDIAEVMNEITDFLSAFDDEIRGVAAITTNLQEQITKARMVPVRRLFRRFNRTVRDTANRENKSVQLMILGEETELDKTVIEEISDPLMHLVRNAVSHGIESPQERAAIGKDKQGTILLNAYPEGNTIIIEVEDDGRGLNLDNIREKTIELGLLSRESAETISQNILIDYIFTPGFTTSETLTEISGRGVGLDVVKQNIINLGGSISVQTEKNIGTRFIIRLPLTLAITQALMVQVSGNVFALPLAAVEETIIINSKEIEKIADQEVLELRDIKIPFLRLGNLLHLSAEQNGRRFVPAVILGGAEARAALLVDELLGQEEIVVKQLGDFLEDLRFFSGATISGDGQVVLILDPSSLVGFEEFAISASGMLESTLKERIAPQPEEKTGEEVLEEVANRLLLVDDSISIRKFVGKLLENAGYTVDVAVDGLEALQMIGKARYNLIITDLEMPRMHGYEFIAEVKKDDNLRGIPVVVLTSRAGEKHKRKAIEKGADGYIVKPFNEEILLDSISKLI